jgi:hypothetical protein
VLKKEIEKNLGKLVVNIEEEKKYEYNLSMC